MNDYKLRNLFADYEPEMQNDAMFMARLERKLRAVEFIREKNAAAKRNNRVAMAIACAAGFLAGGLFISVMPYLTQWLNSLSLAGIFPSLRPEQISPEQISNVLTCCLGCVGTVALTLSSYDIALGLVGHRNVHDCKKRD